MKFKCNFQLVLLGYPTVDSATITAIYVYADKLLIIKFISCKLSQCTHLNYTNSIKFRKIFKKLFFPSSAVVRHLVNVHSTSSHPQLFLTDCETSGKCPQYFAIKSFLEEYQNS
jgi:hypothetical protein